MEKISDVLLNLKEYVKISDNISEYSYPIQISGVSDSQKIHLLYSLCKHLSLKMTYVTSNEIECQKAYRDFCQFFGKDNVIYFPSKNIPLYDIEARNRENIYTRIAAVYKILTGNYCVIVTTIEALIHKLGEPEEFFNSFLEINSTDTINLQQLLIKLTHLGYTRCDMVENKGEFAVRGGIIDIFPANLETAVRIELFDDEIDTIKTFDTDSQRSVENTDNILIAPITDLIYSDDIIENIKKGISKSYDLQLKKFEDVNLRNTLKEKTEHVLFNFDNFKYFAGYEKFINFFSDDFYSLFDYIPQNSLTVVDNLSKCRESIDAFTVRHNELAASLIERAMLLPECSDIYFDIYQLINDILKSKTLFISPFTETNEYTKLNIEIKGKTLSYYDKNMELLLSDIKNMTEDKKGITLLVKNQHSAKSLLELLTEKNISCQIVNQDEIMTSNTGVIIQTGNLEKGFEYPQLNISVITQNDIGFNPPKNEKKKKVKNVNIINTFTELNVGDYVVHQTHGIGKYIGIHQLTVEGVKKDYLKIMYKDNGFIYIPTNQLNLIQKYIGSESKSPRLSSLKGNDWEKTKSRVKESLKEIAFGLVELYAKRQQLKGFKFSEDSIWQSEMEEDFIYEETPDQIKCINEIKADMESDKPMDRLLCGDVGYGKTEVAIRAIFKAVMSGKQVAFLTPTTILAQQQYNTICERFKKYPITIDIISRFRTAKDIKRIAKDTKSGHIDILVGTHRLIQKDIVFKDIGLIVVDEEQRFGVEHKETLKNISPSVDVLTLTATPIPRTLHMSLVGIKDISLLEDPPQNRHPVETYVMEYNQQVIKDAVIDEISRGGQVFYLYNRIQNIDIKVKQLQELIPQAKIAYAHGRMSENILEDTMQLFIDGEIDVLVCTTIIESGLDMPNANTLIIEDADRMGLAQLYQLRGRVGRSDKNAYAYITYRRDKSLSEIAEKRLKAIREYTEFGAGFKIAMRDLEIRGAGNLIGPEQHGHMEAVGYEMYCSLLEQAVKEIKKDGISTNDAVVPDCSIDFNVNAYIDDKYISDGKQKIEMYRKISYINSKADMLDICDEFLDRYGNIPDEVINLINISYLKSMAIKSGFQSIQSSGKNIVMYYKDNYLPDLNVLSEISKEYKSQILFNAGSNAHILYKQKESSEKNILNNLIILLEKMTKE